LSGNAAKAFAAKKQVEKTAKQDKRVEGMV